MVKKNFQECVQGLVEDGNDYLGRFLTEENPLKIALEDARAKGVPEKVIEQAENQGMLDGNLEMTYEGAQRITDKINEMIVEAGKKDNKDYSKMFEAFDPTADCDLIATGIFCLIPEVRDYVRNNADVLYKMVLMTGTSSRVGYTLPTKSRRSYHRGENALFPAPLEELVNAIPESQTNEEEEAQKRFQLLIDTKAEREVFPLFAENSDYAKRALEEKITKEKNPDLRSAYERLLQTYTSYLDLELIDVNENFQNPATGEAGVLPSLHQRSGIYHILNEKKFGIFDGCGTGKTAIAALAAPLIGARLGKKTRTIVVCPNTAKKAWKKGLIGNEQERYLAAPQDIVVVDGGDKREDLMERIENASWAIVNYEQLITRTDQPNKFFVDKLIDLGYDYVVLDESHHIKGHATKTKNNRPTLSKATQMLAHSAKYLAMLTASPIADTLKDYGVPAHLLQPEKFPTPQSLEKAIGNNPRTLYTFFKEKTLRRTSAEINKDLDWEEQEILVELGPIQRKLYDHIIEFRPSNWLTQARKALLDPRLVDPEILKRAGVLGEVSLEDSAKYKQLEKMLAADNGPITCGEKFVAFSTMFREGVTQPGNEYLAQRYATMGLSHLYDELGLDKPLDVILNETLQKKFGKEYKIGVIDGTVLDIEERERIVERLNDDLCGIICTTETGGESLEFTAANHAIFLDEDYTPTTGEQASSRLVRKGQEKKVIISYLRASETLDENLRDYVEKKRIINHTAMDGHPLTNEEIELLEDTKGKKLGELIKLGLGGVSIDTYAAEIEKVDDFEVKKRVRRKKKSTSFNVYSETTTEAQKVMQWIGKDPVNCWQNPEFVELYMQALPNLSVPVTHRAKICNLVKRAQEGEIAFPRSVLSDGSGPSLLYRAYQTLKPVIKSLGYKVPYITDRDVSQLMLDRGNNPQQVLASMTGVDSPFQTRTFDMVDNESISLLPNPDEVKNTLLETHRVLHSEGLVELVVKNRCFSEGFYSGMERLGFELISKKNEGFFLGDKMFKRLKKKHGEHFAESYRNKLANTYLLLARKIDNPAQVDADDFWFEKPKVEENADGSSKVVFIPQAPKQQPENFIPRRVVKIDKWGNVISVKKVREDE